MLTAGGDKSVFLFAVGINVRGPLFSFFFQNGLVCLQVMQYVCKIPG